MAIVFDSLFNCLNDKIDENARELYLQKTKLKIVKETTNEIVLDYAKVKGTNLAIIEKLSDIEKQFVSLNESNEKIMKIIAALPTLNPKTVEIPKVEAPPSQPPTPVVKNVYLPPLPKKDRWIFLKPWKWF